MCKVSEKLKFCTCEIATTDVPRNYWILYRYQGSTVFGQSIKINPLEDRSEVINKGVLLHRVNEKDAFDCELNFEDKDRLKLVFDCGEQHKQSAKYGFEFRGGKWEEITYKTLLNGFCHREEKFGIIEDL